jgi:hypothetical protein
MLKRAFGSQSLTRFAGYFSNDPNTFRAWFGTLRARASYVALSLYQREVCFLTQVHRQMDPFAEAGIIYTSGSTGRAKAVRISAREQRRWVILFEFSASRS